MDTKMSATYYNRRYSGSFPAIRARLPNRTDVKPISLTISDYSTWSEFWYDAHRALQACGYTTSTLLFYRHIVRVFSRYVNRPPSEIGSHDIRKYLLSLTGKDYTWHWTGMNISVLRVLFYKLFDMNVLENQKGPRRKRTLPDHLSRDSISRILGAANTLRDQLIIALLYGCGLKVGELQKLRWQDVDTDNGILSVASHWNHDIRKLPLPKAVLPILREGKDRCPSDHLVFPGARENRPLSARAIQFIVRNCAQIASQGNHVTPLTLRHSYAVHELEAGTNIRHLQTALDHQTIETTMRYLACLPPPVESPLDTASQPPPTQVINIPDPTSIMANLPFPLLDAKASYLAQQKAKLTSRFLAMRRYFQSG